MKRAFGTLACAIALIACGPKPDLANTPSSGAATPAPTGTDTAAPVEATATDWDGLYDRCGIDAMEDPAGANPQDANACLEYVRAAYATDHGDANVLVNADALAEGLCMAVENGEGCRYRALWAQMGIWTGDTTYDASFVTMYLMDGCDKGDQESCSIVKTGQDSSGRAWSINTEGL